jgi:uncharacterized protein YkwD
MSRERSPFLLPALLILSALLTLALVVAPMTSALAAPARAVSVASADSPGAAVSAPKAAKLTVKKKFSIAASSAFQSRVLSLVNKARAKAGVKKLTASKALTKAAGWHSSDQAEMRKGQHPGSDGSRGGDRATAAGFKWRAWGENVAWNYETPDEVFAAWMASPDHRANILSTKFTKFGLATARGSNGQVYWTQMFGAKR